MKMLSNRTGGIPALIFAVLMVILGFSAQNVSAQYNNNNYGNYDDGYYDNDYGDYQEFYDDLSPHGQWLNDPQYGYVWTPNVGRDFRPYYSNGHWVMTEYGNMWASDYSWGWAPFHYGRWAQSAYYGWIWIPGRTWGPAWVTWRQGGGYYGWAPMGPGISINFSFGSGYNAPNAWWTFIPCGNIYSRSYNRYYSPRNTVNIINNTTIINNTYVDHGARNTYVTGPRRGDVETATRQRVTVYNVNNRGRAGAADISGRNVNVYRPSVRAVNTRSQERPAPREVKSLDRSAVTNAGGGRAPSRSIDNGNRGRQQVEGQQMQRDNSRDNQQRMQRDVQQQQREQQNMQRTRDRDQQVIQQRDIQQQQQREAVDRQRSLREQQAQQQRMQRDQQVEQQRMQRDQQQRVQQQQMEQQQRAQRDQQIQQQRVQQQQVEQQQRMQRDQQMQQQRVQQQQVEQQQRMQRDQQMQQQRVQQREVQQQQRNVERAQPQRMERSDPQPQRSVERAPRGR